MKTTAEDLERTALFVGEELDIKLQEMKEWFCCGAVFPLSADELSHQIAPVRTLALAEKENENMETNKLVTLCDMCYNTLKQTNLYMKHNPDKLKTMNDFLEHQEAEKYNGKVEVMHFLELLNSIDPKTIKRKVRVKLKNLKVSPYYGCMLLKPREIAVDDPENPKMLENLLSNFGAEVVRSPLRNECCGSFLTVDHKDIVEKKAGEIVNSFVKEGADAIVLTCPLCKFNLDARQVEKKIPVFYYTELLAIAMGHMPDFSNHKIDPMPLLEEKGFIEQNKTLNETK